MWGQSCRDLLADRRLRSNGSGNALSMRTGRAVGRPVERVTTKKQVQVVLVSDADPTVELDALVHQFAALFADVRRCGGRQFCASALGGFVGDRVCGPLW